MKLKLYIFSIILFCLGTTFANNECPSNATTLIKANTKDVADESKIKKNILEKIHITTAISESNPYLNQAFTVEHKLYVSPDISITNWEEVGSLKFNNFWSQNIDEKVLVVHEGKYKGESYRYVVLKRTLLYPQKKGKLVIEPLTLNISISTPTKERDIFGHFVTENATVTVASENETVDVKPLPLKGKPTNFTGAVGVFDFTIKTDENSLQTPEAFQMSIEVKGNGNLPFFDLPNPNISNKLKISQPKNEDQINTNLNGISGLKKNVYTLNVTTNQEKNTILPVSFNYFNPKTERYEHKTSDEFSIEVIRNEQIRLKINKKNTNH